LSKTNLNIERQKPLPLFYETIREALNDVHKAQVITYLKLSGTKLALLVNFNVVLIKDGIKRIVNNL